jgi:transposase
VSDLTSSCAAVVADTIMRTVELGVTITDAAVDGGTTVVSCGLLTRVGSHARAVEARTYRDTVIR